MSSVAPNVVVLRKREKNTSSIVDLLSFGKKDRQQLSLLVVVGIKGGRDDDKDHNALWERQRVEKVDLDARGIDAIIQVTQDVNVHILQDS